MASPKALFSRARERRPFLDHLVRTVQRYQADTGDRLAASVTYFWFLSLFPILLLAISLLGYVYGDQANARVQDALGGVLPPQLVETLGTTLEQAKGPAGVLGIAGTLYSGLGWIDALREAIRTVWHQNVLAGNIVVRKLVDVVVLVGLFATIAASVLTTTVPAMKSCSARRFSFVNITKSSLNPQAIARYPTYCCQTGMCSSTSSVHAFQSACTASAGSCRKM